MVSEASWHSGVGRYGDAPSSEGPMDQQSVESLLRRLVQRVEESERRYSEALDELHARLDQLAQKTDAARTAGAPDDSATFDRLHDEVSSLARRLELEASNPLDDFERLGRALSGDLNYAASLAGPASSTPGRPSAFPAFPSEPPLYGGLPSHFPLPDVDYSAPAPTPTPAVSDSDLDSRLAEMAHRLEDSVGMPMPPALDALSARLDEISRNLAKALEAPKTLSLEPVERQIADMAQQLSRAETQLAKIGEIESALLQLIERVDASPSPGRVASKAAEEAARRVADEAKLSGDTAERLDAMHRDLMAMNDRTKSSDDKLAGTIEAVHASLKELAQQVEHAASAPPPPAPPPAPAAKPRVPFAERMRDLAPLPGTPGQQPPAGMAWRTAKRPRLPRTIGRKGKPGHARARARDCTSLRPRQAGPLASRLSISMRRPRAARRARHNSTPNTTSPTISWRRHAARLRPPRPRPKSGEAAHASGDCRATPRPRWPPRLPTRRKAVVPHHLRCRAARHQRGASL